MKFYEKVYYLSHELCHYVAARLLGVEAKLHVTYVTTWSNSGRRKVLIALAPSIFGLLAWGIMIWIDYNKGLYYLTACGFILNLWWQYSCKRDFQRVWAYLKVGEWPGRKNGGKGEPG